jgi:hypothetical protein
MAVERCLAPCSTANFSPVSSAVDEDIVETGQGEDWGEEERSDDDHHDAK